MNIIIYGLLNRIQIHKRLFLLAKFEQIIESFGNILKQSFKGN